ncbi:CDP-diacylglycerol--glycerol-3-phosphate 3-phosphatidyltransferase [Aeromicrobium stalagmiti]|uniref:CDP-diacylglycerol--glycerol-3-phosphate 3-phosphatidyltransferase n=1 Tax=Aeromicrobium stalagmiti TaxID=2738988 RepID=UPI001569176F|nr:CDP-diacylglycerol--glycerol-3-phosphate 3-phosphatidyltransferase [Aeromicrobium stalagmiti]NRQ50337.1 CDP-diacylglycerol--glycerol-3-phosphate 3-phosphatidyltransferase [Aeromicrobium stalagmiti]
MDAATTPSNLNIANVLTVVRIVGVPFFGWLLLADGGESVGLRVAAWAAFVVLMITDRIDGDLARKYDLVTNFGKLADPIADKALTGMAFVGLAIIFSDAELGWLFWTVTIVVLVREWGITLMRFVVKKYGVMPAGQGGKIKTTLQAVALGGYLLPFEIWDNVPSDVLRWIAHILMAGAVAITLSTGVQYVRDAIALRRESKAAASS